MRITATNDMRRIGGILELAVLRSRKKALDCRVLADGREIIFKTEYAKDFVPGEIIRIAAEKFWAYAGQENVSGKIHESRIDAKALGLVPLVLNQNGIWDPLDMDWGEEGPTIEEWTMMLPVSARGIRLRYEMEQVIPGAGPDDDFDPIIESNMLKDQGDAEGAKDILMELCTQDIRCLDAHAHLGNLMFSRNPELAVKHYQVGLLIGELSLGSEFDGLLPWVLIDNRPFLRCLHGYGLGRWKMGGFKEAEAIFLRMLLLNPTDNQGARLLIDRVKNKLPWRDYIVR